MRRLRLIDISHRLVRIRIDHGRRRFHCSRGHAHQFNTPVRRSGLMSVDRKGKRSVIGVADNINGIFLIIDKAHVHHAFCDRRILGQIHVGHCHRVVRTRCHFQFRFQYCIVKGRGNLADSAAIRIDHPVLLIGWRWFIAVFCSERRNGVCYGEVVSGIQKRPADLTASVLHIDRPLITGK